MHTYATPGCEKYSYAHFDHFWAGDSDESPKKSTRGWDKLDVQRQTENSKVNAHTFYHWVDYKVKIWLIKSVT
jgi:hypothetical protein